jgi:hypothetical protein
MGAWRTLMTEALKAFGERVAEFFPNLAGALLLLLLGWLISRMVKAAASRLLRGLGVDRAAGRLRITATLAQAGVQLPVSEVVGLLLFWLSMLVFLASGVQTLGLTAVSETIERLTAYLPNLIAAVFVALLGMLLARFGGGATASAAAAAGITGARSVGLLVQTVLVALAMVIAAEQLGVATTILVGPLTAVLAAAALAAGLAFALGARPVITHILAGHFLKQSLPRDAFVEIGGRRGVVERVGPTDTVFRDGDQRWSLPNAHLLEMNIQYPS